jgi:tetratricopeptide (TPR) repeat protein
MATADSPPEGPAPGGSPAIADLRVGLEARRTEGRQPGLLRAYRQLGCAYLAEERLDEAESALRTAIAQARIHGDPLEIGQGLLELGRAQRGLGRADRALLAYTEAAGCLAGLDSAALAAATAGLQSLGSVPGGAR